MLHTVGAHRPCVSKDSTFFQPLERHNATLLHELELALERQAESVSPSISVSLHLYLYLYRHLHQKPARELRLSYFYFDDNSRAIIYICRATQRLFGDSGDDPPPNSSR